MKLRNKHTGLVGELHYEPDKEYHFTVATEDPADMTIHKTLAQLSEVWEDYKPAKPLIEDEKIRKAVRAWADVLEIDEVEFYGSEKWIGFRSETPGTGWLSKFELDYFGSENTLVPFRTYSIAELCGEEE